MATLQLSYICRYNNFAGSLGEIMTPFDLYKLLVVVATNINNLGVFSWLLENTRMLVMKFWNIWAENRIKPAWAWTFNADCCELERYSFAFFSIRPFCRSYNLTKVKNYSNRPKNKLLNSIYN